jgi:hypothetical protein
MPSYVTLFVPTALTILGAWDSYVSGKIWGHENSDRAQMQRNAFLHSKKKSDYEMVYYFINKRYFKILKPGMSSSSSNTPFPGFSL